MPVTGTPINVSRWAVITGASSGIGRSLAYELARRRFSLVLISRDGERLHQIAKECRDLGAIEVDARPTDLGDAQATETLAAELRERSIEVLVNNAGSGLHGSFNETDGGVELQMVEVQLAAMLRLTKAVLPGMIARGQGRILNIASVYSLVPVGRQAVYAATKAFLHSFSASLRAELRNTGVTVTVCYPGTTRTEFRRRADIRERPGAGMDPDAVARAAVAAALTGRRSIIPGWPNRLFLFAARLLPVSLQAGLVRTINRRRGVDHQDR